MNEKNGISVSICVPVYNGGKYLRETLDTLVRQDYPHREIIISENASTDDTPGIIREFQERYPIRSSRCDRHLAGEDNLNRCVQLAQGEAVCVFHADDLYAPDIVARQAAMLERHENVGAVFTMADVINEQGKVFSRYVLPPELKRLSRDVYRFDEIFGCLLKYENSFLVCPSAMVRKKVYDELGAWEYEKYKSASDLGLWLKIAQRYDIAIIDAPLVRYRISRQQGSFLLARQRTEEAHYFILMETFADRIRNHLNARYYTASKIKDRVYRALNLSAGGRTGESQALLKEALGMAARDFGKIILVPKAAVCTVIAVLVYVINLLPGQRARVWFRSLVLTMLGLKKSLFSY